MIYSNYLAEVGKLVFIIGQIETTSSFKKLLDTNNDQKNKYFFKCLDELPVNTYKKIVIQCRRKGILRCDWFNKILDRSPLMIFMVFNFSQSLDANQKWQDRLSLALKKINKVYDILRSSNKQEVILRIIIIISKQAVLQSVQTGNIIDKITNFLKSYEKQLSIYQSDQLTKEANKNKTYWFTMLDKAYDRKYKSITKRKQQSFAERRLGCIIKMAVITQIQSKKESYMQYEQAYRALHFRFIQITKNKIQFINYDSVREVRTLADIVLLRKLIVKMTISNNFQSVPDSITNHMKLFYHHSQNQHFFFSYETMMWRQNFIHNLLEVLYTNDHVEVVPKSFFAQLINTAISLSYKLCKASLEIEPFLRSQVKGRMIPSQKELYIGSRNYLIGLQITDLDVLWTQMNQLIDRNRDFITRGLQTITRYKSMRIFKKHEVNFFNVYLLRFYLADDKFGSIGNIFNEIIKLKIAEYDFYSLNYLIDQLQKQSEKSSEHRVLIHNLAVLISDYFKNKDQLQKYGQMLMKILPNKVSKSDSFDLLSMQTSQSSIQTTPQKDPLVLPLPSSSYIFSLQVLFPEKMHPIERQLQITVIPKFDNKFLLQSDKKAKLKIYFNKSKIQYERQIDFKALQQQKKLIIIIQPLKYFTHDEQLQIKSAVLITETNPQIHFFLQNIIFLKYRSVLMVTKLKMPEININLPYQIIFLNQVVRFKIFLTNVNKATKIQATFSVNEQPPTNNTEVYKNINQRMNLTNSNCFQIISPEEVNVFYLKPSKIGTKVLKFLFNLTITQQIGDKQLKDQNFFHKEIGFKVNSIFKTLKILKQSKTGHQIKPNEIPTNKNIIMCYNIRATQNIKILQLGHHKSPKPYFKTYKNIKTITNYNISPDQKLNNIYIFEVLEEELKAQQKKQLFLISFYIKWSRIDMDKKLNLKQGHQFPQIVNLYNQDDVKISLKSDKVEVEYQQGKTLRKRQKETLSIKYRNLTNRKIHVYSIMDNSQQILRIGSRGTQVQLGPKQTKIIVFEILPVKSGYFKYPNVRSFFDGLEAKQKTSSSIICVV